MKLFNFVGQRAKTQKKRRDAVDAALKSRRLKVESLEERQLLAVGVFAAPSVALPEIAPETSNASLVSSVEINQPGDFVFGEYNAGNLEMSWGDNSDNEDGFVVQYSYDGNTWNRGGTTATDVNYRTATSVVPGRTYYFRVAAFQGKTYSDWTYGEYAAPSGIPTAPGEITFDSYSAENRTVEMSWVDNSNNETGFRVEYSLDGGNEWRTSAQTSANVNYRTANGLRVGETYQFRVRSYNAYGSSDWSYGSYTVPAPDGAPAAPSDFVFGDYDPVSKTLEMSWTDNADDETGYKVQYSADGGATWRTAGNYGADVTSRTATKVVSGTTYTFRVAAYNDVGSSAWLVSDVYDVNNSNYVPAAPTDIVFGEYDAAARTLPMSWTDNSDNETGFLVEYSVNGGETWNVSERLAANVTSRTATRVVAGREYYFRVAAYNGYGISDYAVGSHTAIVEDEIEAPTNLVLTYSAEEGQITVAWEGDAESYNVQYQPDENSDWLDLSASGTSAVLSDATYGLVYNFRVQAVAEDGTVSEWATGSLDTTEGYALTAPVVSVESYDADTTTVKLVWEDQDNETSYVVSGTVTNLDGEETALDDVTLDADVVSYEYADVEDGYTYSFTATAVNAMTSAESDATAFATALVTLDAGEYSSGDVLTASLTSDAASATWLWYGSDDAATWTELDGETSATLSVDDEIAAYAYVKVVATGTGVSTGSSSEAVATLAETPTEDVASTVVTTLKDVVDASDGLISLREAIDVYSSSGDTVTFAESLKGGTITLENGQFTISKTLTIDASALYDEEANTPGITIDADGASRHFTTSWLQSLTLNSLALINGYAENANGGSINAGMSSTLNVSRCVFAGNSAGKDGGAISASYSTATIDSSVFQDNASATAGGAIAVSYGNNLATTVTNSTFCGNTAESYGGAILASYLSKVTLTNVEMYDNASVEGGGAIRAMGTGSVALYNTTIADNTSTNNASAVYVADTATLDVYNSIIATNTTDVVAEDGTTLNAHAVLSAFENWSNDDALYYGYDADLDLFNDAENDDYTLAPESQACNRGLNDYVATDDDLAGNVRIYNDGTVDLGAYESESDYVVDDDGGDSTEHTVDTETKTVTDTNGNVISSGSATVAFGNTKQTISAAYLIDGVDVVIDSGAYASASGSSDQVVFLVVNGGSLTVTGSSSTYVGISKSGSGATGGQVGDEYNFYGINSGIVVSGEGSSATIQYASITTAANGANAVVATNGATVTISDSEITTTGSVGSRGLHATYEGVIVADSVEIATSGQSCASLATDRGGGTITASNMTLETNGAGSPLVYSTGTINVTDSTGTANGAQMVVVEGGSSATVTRCEFSCTGAGNRTGTSESNSSSHTIDAGGIFIYQSFSGDASDGTDYFTATDSSFTVTTSGVPMFYITNITAEIALDGNDFTQASSSDYLFVAEETNQWGTVGKNGGKATVTLTDQDVSSYTAFVGSSSSSLTIKATDSSSTAITKKTGTW